MRHSCFTSSIEFISKEVGSTEEESSFTISYLIHFPNAVQRGVEGINYLVP